MTIARKGRLAIGLIGVGRLGRVYARDLAGRIAETRLVAVADPVGTLAQEVAAEFDVPRHYTDPQALIDDAAVEAIVIVSPTDTHRQLVIAAAQRGKPTFCEKPPALSLDEIAAMKEAIAKSGIFFQMGFMRRFDSGYAAAKKQIEGGRIGTPRTMLPNATPQSRAGTALPTTIATSQRPRQAGSSGTGCWSSLDVWPSPSGR